MSDTQGTYSREQVEERIASEAACATSPSAEQGIESDFVARCFDSNEVGDGTLFAELHRGTFAYNVDTKDEWLMFADHHWQRDKTGRRFAAVEKVVDLYLREADRIQEQIDEAEEAEESKKAARLGKKKGAILSRVHKLRGMDRRRNCLEGARTCENPLVVGYEDLDTNPMLFACKNGVIDLTTGRIRDGRPTDWITRASQIEYRGIKEDPRDWIVFLDTSLGDPELVGYLQRLFGYAITGLNTLRIFPVFHGLYGQNGKGTIFNMLYHILGPYAGPIQSEMLIASRNLKSSSGPSPDIMDLKGKRLVWGSETEEGQRFASAKVKLLTGSDPLVGRNPNDRHQTTFLPTHKLFLLTNSKPGAPAHDNAFWIRQRLIEFPFSFVEEPKESWERKADVHLEEKLRAEAPLILGWLVKGCLDWQRHGLQTPAKVKQDTAKYRRGEDLLADFIDECCEVDQDKSVNSTTLYNVFRAWWKENVPNRKELTHRKFGDLMKLKFGKDTSGTVTYLGVGVRSDWTTKGMTRD